MVATATAATKRSMRSPAEAAFAAAEILRQQWKRQVAALVSGAKCVLAYEVGSGEAKQRRAGKEGAGQKETSPTPPSAARSWHPERYKIASSRAAIRQGQTCNPARAISGRTDSSDNCRAADIWRCIFARHPQIASPD